MAEHTPVVVERHLSDQVVQVMHRLAFGPSRTAPERQRELRGKFAALVAGEPRAEQMRLLFTASPRMGANAFALPAGRTYITDELLTLASNDEQILAVLAHEAGHHARRHGMRQAIESSSVFVAVGLLFGDVSGSSLAVALPGILLSNGFSRGHEREADRYALALLRRRGHSPTAFADIMQRLEQAHPGAAAEHAGPGGYLSTHPPTPERIRAARQAAAQP